MVGRAGLLVLKAFLETPGELAGTQIIRASGVKSGTLYPLLLRFEAEGVLTSRWEQVDPAAAKRPRRRYYRLTDAGRRLAEDALAELQLSR